jgi:hypothetical protein
MSIGKLTLAAATTTTYLCGLLAGRQGVKVMITIFSDFHQFSAKEIGVFL